jgi:hypothetical protein
MSPVFLVSYGLLWLLMAVLFVGVFALYHHFGQIYLTSRAGRQEQGPAEGSLFQPIEATVLDGDPVVIPHANKPSLVIFASTDCALCGQLRAGIARVADSHPEVDLYVACAGPERMVRAWASDVGDAVPVIADPRARISTRYRVGAWPFVIAIGDDGAVRGRGLVNDDDGLERAVLDAITLPLATIAPEERSTTQ